MIKTLAVLLAVKGGSGFKAQMSQASASVKKFERDIDGSGKRTSKSASGLKTAFAGLAVAAALFFANAISQAVQFEGAMRNVNSISMLSEQQLSTLSNKVIALSTKVPQSASNLAEGLYDIASSGFQGAEGMKVLEASAYAASAGLSTTAVSAKAIAQVLNAYGLSADHAADVSDVLFQTVNLGVVSFEELATQLGDVVGGAAAAGIAIDEVGAAVAAMTLSGLGAAESTTSLNNLIRSLIKPSDGLAAAYKNLGIESGEAELKEKGLHGVMEQLRISTGGNITTLLKLFPEIRAARGAFALMANDGQNYAKTFRAIADEQSRAGATQRAFREQMKGLGQQWKLFMNNVDAVSIKLGTALIPVLKDALAAGRDAGSTLVGWFKQLAEAATPTARRIADAVVAISEALETVLDVVVPVAQGLGAIAGAAILAGLSALATSIGAVAGFLADHPGLVQAVAVAYGSMLVSKLMLAGAAFLNVQKGLLGVRIGLAALAAQSVLQDLALRISYIGDSLYAVFSTGNLKNLGNFKTAFEGLGPAAANFATALAAGGALIAIYAVVTGLQTAEKKAQALRAELEKDIDFNSMKGIQEGLEMLSEEWNQLSDDFEAKGDRIGRTVKGFWELATPAENTVADNKKAMEAISDAYDDAVVASDNLWSATNQLKSQFGLTQGAAESMLRELDFDPTAELNLAEIVAAAQDLIYTASAATPALGGLSDATETVADVTSTAADRVGALKTALDALFGVAISAREAEAGLAESIANLDKSVSENGLTFDVWTEKGRANEDALRGNIDAIIDLANATAEETGAVSDGVAVLGLYREQLMNNLTSMGLSRQAAGELLATYGLTPENLETLVSLEGVDSAQAAMTDLQGMLDAIGEAQVTGEVRLNTEDFDGDAAAVASWVEQIALAAPEATVYLDNELFVAKAADVMRWSRKYEDSSPEAQALLNIIDPQHKYTSLSDAAQNWGSTSTSGTAGLHNNAASPMGQNAERLSAWNRSRGTATASLTNNASGPLNGIWSLLGQINGYVAHATVNVTATGASAAAIAAGKDRRWGGIDYAAADGMAWQAGITMDPTILYGERETGGEAFVPRNGIRSRSVSILETAAGWYGMDVVPKGKSQGSYMSQVTNVGFNINVSVRAEAGVDKGRLVKEIDHQVSRSVEKQLGTLKRELSRR